MSKFHRPPLAGPTEALKLAGAQNARQPEGQTEGGPHDVADDKGDDQRLERYCFFSSS
jgi:hypothetical protein